MVRFRWPLHATVAPVTIEATHLLRTPEAAPARMPVSGGKKVSGVAFALRKGTRASQKGCCATLTAEQDIRVRHKKHHYSSTRCNRDKVREMRATWHDFGVTVVAWLHAGFCLFWTQKVRRGQLGLPVISREVQRSDPQEVPGGYGLR
jgi:hypothetical protein